MSEVISNSAPAAPLPVSEAAANMGVSPIVPAASAQTEINTLKSDKAFAAKLLSGDKPSLARWEELHKAAYPSEAPAGSESPQSAAPKEQPAAGTGGDISTEVAQEKLTELDQWFPKGEEQQFRVPSLVEPGKEITPDTAKADKQVRGWLSEASFPAGLGSAVAQQVAESSTAYEAMDPPTRELWARKQEITFNSHFGDKAEEMRELAKGLVLELEAKSPGLIRVLKETGAADNAMIVTQLANQAMRNRDRKTYSEKLKKK